MLNKLVFILLACFLLLGCQTTRPSQPDDLCSVFKEKPKWYRAAKKGAERWKGPIYMPMAIMYHESGFKHNARPPMRYFLWVIPKGRASSAYGYSQALKSTWAQYKREEDSRFSDRDNFSNAYDFVQWYMHKTYTKNGIAKNDGYNQYLNYHEGQAGFARGTHRNKGWLLNVARGVDQRARRYASQLAQCQASLDKKRGFLWF